MVVYENKGAMAATIVVAASDSLNKAAANYVCDGTADNVEIQAAIDALPAGGGKVVLLEGNYNIINQILISRTGIDFSGQGPSTIIKIVAGSAIDAIKVHGVGVITGITLTDFAVDGSLGSGSGVVGAGIYVLEVSRLKIKNLYVHDTYLTGIRVYNYTEITIKSNIVVNSGRGSNAPCIGISKGRGATISGNICIGGAGTDECIDCNAGVVGDANSNTSIVSNVLSGALQEGIDFTGYNYGAVASSNAIYDCLVGINCGGSNAGFGELIVGNHIYDCGTGIKAETGADISFLSIVGNKIYSASSRGISAVALSDSIIIGNWIYDSGMWGIDIVGIARRIAVVGNLVMNSDQGTTGRDGIALRGDVAYCTVNSNICSDNQGGPTQNYGINESGTANYNNISNNICVGNQVGAIKKVGANTIVKNNIGYVTENSGSATVLSGTTSIAVAHGLAATPTRIQITPRENPTNAVSFWWVDTVGAANFTINVNADPGASNLDFDWHAQVGEG